MAFLIQECKACQPLTHFKPDCVKEWEEWMKKYQKKDSRCERAGGGKKGKEVCVGSSEKRDKGVGFEKDAIQAFFFYDTHLPQEWECSINMVISPQAIASVEEGRSSILYMQPWTWMSRLEIPVEWLRGWLRGSSGNGSQASLKVTFPVDKENGPGWGEDWKLFC